MKKLFYFLLWALPSLSVAQNTPSSESVSQHEAKLQIQAIDNVKKLASYILQIQQSQQKMLFIFDIDGVLTNDSNGNSIEVNPRGDILKLVKTLSDSEHSIVFSSAWNNFEETIMKIQRLGLSEIAKLEDESTYIQENQLTIHKNGNLVSVRSENSSDPYFRNKAFSPLYASTLGHYDSIIFVDDSKHNCNLFVADIQDQGYAKEKNIHVLNISSPNPRTLEEDRLDSVRLSAQTLDPSNTEKVKDVVIEDVQTGFKRKASGLFENGRIELCDDFLVFPEVNNCLSLKAYKAETEIPINRLGQERFETKLSSEEGHLSAIRFDLLLDVLGKSMRFSFRAEKREALRNPISPSQKFIGFAGTSIPPTNCIYFDQDIFNAIEIKFPSISTPWDSSQSYVVQEEEQVSDLLYAKIAEYIKILFDRYNGHSLPNDTKQKIVHEILLCARLKGWVKQSEIPALMGMFGY